MSADSQKISSNSSQIYHLTGFLQIVPRMKKRLDDTIDKSGE
jgi:hypothetical protein